MALDTRNKRASALGVGLAFALVLPAPDGTVEQADRQQTAYSYAGISAQATVVFDHACARTLGNLTPRRTLASVTPVRTMTSTTPTRTLACLED